MIYLSKRLDKACFQHDMTYGDFEDLARRTASDRILHYKGFNIDKNPKYDRYQRSFALMIYKFFDKKTSVKAIKNEVMSNKELAGEFQKPIIAKAEKTKYTHLY